MVKVSESKYLSGSESHNWLKRKFVEHTEATVVTELHTPPGGGKPCVTVRYEGDQGVAHSVQSADSHLLSAVRPGDVVLVRHFVGGKAPEKETGTLRSPVIQEVVRPAAASAWTYEKAMRAKAAARPAAAAAAAAPSSPSSVWTYDMAVAQSRRARQ